MQTLLEFIMKSSKIYPCKSAQSLSKDAFSNRRKILCIFELQLEIIIWYWSLIHLFLDTTKRLYIPSYHNVRRDSSVHFLLLTPLMLHVLWALCLRNTNICISVGKPNSHSMEHHITVSSVLHFELHVSSERVQLVKLKFLFSSCLRASMAC